jgi:pimeloyl-ACP methyl ester carboxylesterase
VGRARSWGTLGLPLAAVLLLSAAPAGARPRLGAPCGQTAGLLCATLAVPLDRSGTFPGTVSLHVEVLPPAGPSRGTMFLLAGGPGQGSARTYDLGTPANAAVFQFLFPGYTLVAYDDRGTGASGLIDCPGLQTATDASQEAQLAATCAAAIGPQRSYYGTADHAEDLEAVRQLLGVDKVALFGVSYGTKLALAYALAHPDHVERLVLDSVVPPELPDAFGGNVLRALPATLQAFCENACNAATHDFAGDVVAVANTLAAKPVRGNVLQANGKTKSERLDGLGVLGIVVDSDLNPGLAAELPAAVHAARAGNVKPLLRLYDLDNATSQFSSADLSFGLLAATNCRDGAFPWSPDSPVSARQALLDQAIAGLPAGSLGPFGSWAAKSGTADLCLDWPSPAGGGVLGTGPLPDVPVLAISGGDDLRTPTANASAVVARFPQGRLLVVPGIGHSVVLGDPSLCAFRAVRGWILGDPPPASCPRSRSYLEPLATFPAATSAGRAAPLATYGLALKTIREAEAAWLMTRDKGGALAGLYSGKIVVSDNRFRLADYSIAPGVTVSGTVTVTSSGPPSTFQGLLTIGGRAAAAGTLGLVGDSLKGTLGGRRVGG